MSVVEKVFLGSLVRAELLIEDTVLQQKQLEITGYKEIMRKTWNLIKLG